jgi:hypothetical protein
MGNALTDSQPILADVAVWLNAGVLPARLAPQVEGVVSVDEGQLPGAGVDNKAGHV